MSVIKRTKYFIKPGFQSRLAAIMVLVVIIVANIVGGLIYCFSYESLTRLCTEYRIPGGAEPIGRLLLPGVLISEVLSVIIAGMLCIKITHIVAGPVYRMERVARGIGEGDLTNFIKLRQKDELKDLADSMNEMTLGLRNKVISLKENFAEVRDGFNALKSSIPAEKFEAVSQKMSDIEETLQAFVLEKEQRTRFEDEEEEEKEEEKEEVTESENKTYETNKNEKDEEKKE